MSDSVIFDAVGFVKRGVDVGVPREHAEWLAQEQIHSLQTNLATKTDIELLRKDTTALVLEAKNELTKEINNSQFKIVGLLAGFASLLFMLNKLF